MEKKILNPTAIVITEIKINSSISDSEICIDGYCAIWRDRNRKDEVVVCYVTNKIC